MALEIIIITFDFLLRTQLFCIKIILFHDMRFMFLLQNYDKVSDYRFLSFLMMINSLNKYFIKNLAQEFIELLHT